jgi:hypothetical protein
MSGVVSRCSDQREWASWSIIETSKTLASYYLILEFLFFFPDFGPTEPTTGFLLSPTTIEDMTVVIKMTGLE